MKEHSHRPEELELFQIVETGQKLDRRSRELEEIKRKTEAERSDRENTLPPLAMVEAIERQKQHDETISRRQARNVHRKQGKGLLLLAFLVATSMSLVWWGLTLMDAG